MFGNYKSGKITQAAILEHRRTTRGKLSYQDSSDKIIKISSKDSSTGLTVSQDMRLAVLRPTSSYMPQKEDVCIYQKMTSLSFIRTILSKLTGLIAVDIETRGTCAHISDNIIVGVGIADASNIFYIDFSTSSKEVVDYTLEFLREYEAGCVGHNVFFDGAFLLRDTTQWLNWKYDTYALYRQLANEGYAGQKWGLKSAQEQLLNWESKGDVELDEWLVNNEHISDIKKTAKDGYVYLTQYKDKGERWARPLKSEMWRAPADILGFYCGLDAASTYQLLTEVLLPSISGQAYEKQVLDYHELFMENVRVHCNQQMSGITVDKAQLEQHHKHLLEGIKNHTSDFLNHPEVRPHADLYNESAIKELALKEPVKYKKVKWPKEPTKLKVDGTVSKHWTVWDEKTKRLKEEGPQETSHWKIWNDKMHIAKTAEHFNPNSGAQLQWLFYERLDYPVIIKTKTGQPSTGSEVLPAFGEIGKFLQSQKNDVKEEGYVSSCLEHLQPGEDGEYRIHPQFRMPGTLTCRLAGSGGLNIQQLPKSRGYLDCWRPKKGKVWIDCDHCLTPDHQVLTKVDGWINILDVKTTHEVWQVDPITLVGSWTFPLRTIKKDYEGDVYTFGNTKGKLAVTDKHRMLFVGQQSHPKRKVQRWETLAEEGIPTTGACLPITSTNTLESNFTDHEIWMACLLQADGSQNKAESYTVTVSKQRKIDMITKLLGREGREYDRQDGIRQPSRTWCGIKFENKIFKDKSFNLKELGQNQAGLFLEALAFWDGSLDKGSVIFSCTDERNVDEIQSYFARCGYEAKKSKRVYKDSHWADLFSLRIRKRTEIRLGLSDMKVDKYQGEVGCITVGTGYFMVRREGQTFITGNCALEQVVLAELSQDKSLLSLYSPTSPDNDVYLFNAALMSLEYGVRLFDPIVDAGYDPFNPRPEIIKAVKKEFKALRGISKTASLGKSYGMGWRKFQLNMKLAGIKLSEDECRAVIEGLDQVYSGVKQYEIHLLSEYKKNNGYVINGVGRPVGCAQDYLKDIVNRVVQSTGHDIHMMYIKICDDLFKEHDVNVRGIVLDFHDQSIFECDEKDKDLVYHLVGTKAYEILNNNYLQGSLPLKGDPMHIDTLSDAKCE